MEGINLLLLLITSFVLSVSFIPLIIRFSRKLGVYDLPDPATGKETKGRKVHTAPIPRLGGVAIVVGYFLSLLIWEAPFPLWRIFLPSLILFITGLVDDLRPLSAEIRILIQILAAALAILLSGLSLTHINLLPSLGVDVPVWIGFFLSVFVIVGAINSINMIDGLDGLAGGIVIIGISLLGYHHYITTGDLQTVGLLHFPIVAAMIGFLRYNTHPASIFMGDGGSNWLGYISGVLILLELQGRGLPGTPGTLSGAPEMLFVSSILLFAVPIFDTAYVILLRLARGRNPFLADQSHFHHGLMKIGLSQGQAVTFIYFLSLVSGVVGLSPALFDRDSFWWAPYLFSAFLFLIIPLIGMIDIHSVERIRILYYRLKKFPGMTESSRWFFHNWERANRYTIYLILFATPFVAGVPPKIIGYTAGAMLLFILIFVFLPSAREDFLDSLIISLGVTVVLISNNVNPIWIELQGERHNIQFLYNWVFIFLFVSSTLYFLATLNVSDLIITPTDFLMVMLPLFRLLAPETLQSEFKLRTIGMRSLVLFMALRTIIRREHRFMYRIQLVTFAALGYVMMTGVFGFRFVY